MPIMKNRSLKEIPQFKNEDEERKFWSKVDPLDYFDPNSAEEVIYPELKPTKKLISIRFPNILIYEVKTIANKKGVPYQSLIKEFVSKGVKSSYLQ